MADRQLILTVRAREKELFSGNVKSVTSYNDRGKFDVLDMHTNFISIIKDALMIRMLDDTTKEIKLDNGIMRVLNNKVDVFLGVKQTPEKERPLKT